MVLPRTTCLSIVGVILVVIGITILILGIVVTPKEFPKIFNHKLNKYIVIDSKRAEQYDNWAGQSDVDNPYYMEVYMYNLSNLFQVVERSSTPLYDIVGPYMYRRYRQAINVSFPDGGNKIQYADFVDYVFDANASGSLSDTDIITNINPVYIGALMQANINSFPAEQNVLFAAAGGMIKTYTDYFTGPFVSLFTAYTFPNYFSRAMAATILAMNSTYSDPYQVFVDTWRNSTTAPSVGNWNGLLLSNETLAEITYDSAVALLNASVGYSLLDNNPEAAWFWDQCKGNASILVTLSETFAITPDQVKFIWNWKNSVFAPTIIYPDVTHEFNLEDMADVGWVQWAMETPLGAASAVTTFPDMAGVRGFNTPIELGTASSTWSQWKHAMSNTTGLQNITNYQSFIREIAVNGTKGDFSKWGLDGTMAGDYFSYIARLLVPQIVPTIKANVGSTGGLFTSRTVSGWTLNCNDYMLNLLKENPPMCAFRANHSATPISTIYSGKSNLNLVNTFEEWQGQTSVNVWAQPIPVVGHTQLGQFTPRHLSRAPLAVFQDDLIRTVYMNFSSNVTVRGIAADRYVLDFNRTFAENSLYYQSVYGTANMTAVHNGTPIFLSSWGMLNVPNAGTMVLGLNATNEFDDSTVIDIEPTTGITIQSRKRMQINLNVPADNDAWFGGESNFQNDNFTSGIIYPLAQIGEYSSIDAEQASSLQAKLNLTPRVKHISFYIGVTTGPVLVVLGFAFMFLARQKRHEEEREHLIQ